jgi:hypothetical protein
MIVKSKSYNELRDKKEKRKKLKTEVFAEPT